MCLCLYLSRCIFALADERAFAFTLAGERACALALAVARASFGKKTKTNNTTHTQPIFPLTFCTNWEEVVYCSPTSFWLWNIMPHVIGEWCDLVSAPYIYLNPLQRIS
jgi:hypothetical protein